jgi:hypothetical protein
VGYVHMIAERAAWIEDLAALRNPQIRGNERSTDQLHLRFSAPSPSRLLFWGFGFEPASWPTDPR